MPSQSFHNPEYRRKKMTRRLRIFYIISGIIVVLITGFALLTHWSKIQIDTVAVSGNKILLSENLEDSVKQFISGNYLFIFAKNNLLLYPHTGLTPFLQKEFPRIRTIEVGLSNYHTINVVITEREPTALWCDTVPMATSTTAANCYFLDATGFVFAHAPDFSGDAYFKYYGLLPYAAPIGSSYLNDPGTFALLAQFARSVKALNITPLYIVAQSQDAFTLYLYGGGQIIFDDKTSLSDTTDRLVKLLNTAGLIPKSNGQLFVQYIDLRFGDKIYYKTR